MTEATADRTLQAVLTVTVETRPDGGHYFDQADFAAHAREWLRAALKGQHAVAEVTVTEQRPADRAVILAEAADAVFALDYDVMVGEEGDENLGSMREAWDLGTIHAEKLLRRLAAEAQPTTKPDRCPHGCDTSTCPCLACEDDESIAAGVRQDGAQR